MANENIGDIPCPFYGHPAHVRRYNPRKPPKEGEGTQRGKFYIHCSECGPILASSKRVQEYILEKGKFYGAHKPTDSEQPKPAQASPSASRPPQGTPANPAAAQSKPKRNVFDDEFFDN